MSEMTQAFNIFEMNDTKQVCRSCEYQIDEKKHKMMEIRQCKECFFKKYLYKRRRYYGSILIILCLVSWGICMTIKYLQSECKLNQERIQNGSMWNELSRAKQLNNQLQWRVKYLADFIQKYSNISQMTQLQLKNINNTQISTIQYLPFNHLSNLTFTKNTITPQYYRQFITHINTNSLASLSFKSNSLADYIFNNITLQFPLLKQLNIYQQQITDQTLKFLGNIPMNLQILVLQFNDISCDGILEMSRWNMDNLRELNLNFNNIGGDGVMNLLRMNMSNMESLQLRNNSIRDKGMQSFCDVEFKNLKRLNLYDNNISNIECIKKENLQNLLSLYISNGNKLDQASQNYIQLLEQQGIIVY